MVSSSPRCFIVNFFVMALRMFGLEQVLELVTAGDNDEENLSDDEMVGDFVTDSGQNVVLSGETLARASDMSVSLPDPSEMDSLLLDDTGGNGGDSDEENGKSMGRNEHETGDSGSGESAFDYDWCEAGPNPICTELPEFQEPSGLSREFWSWKIWSPGPKFSLENMVRLLKTPSFSNKRI